MKKTRQIIMEREKLIKVIQKKYKVVQNYMANSKSAKLVVSSLRSDAKLIEHIYSMLDNVSVFVGDLEKALKKEKSYQSAGQFKTVSLNNNSTLNSVLVSFGNYSRETRFNKQSVSYLTTKIANKKNTYKNFSRTVCSFSKWDEFIKNIEIRVALAFEDLKKLNQIEQDKNLIKSKLEEIYYKP